MTAVTLPSKRSIHGVSNKVKEHSEAEKIAIVEKALKAVEELGKSEED